MKTSLIPGDYVQVTLKDGEVIKGEVHDFTDGQLTLLTFLVGCFQVVTEWRNIEVIDPSGEPSIQAQKFLPYDLVAAMQAGRADAANFLALVVAGRLERGVLGKGAMEIISRVFREMHKSGTALRYMNPGAPKTRPNRSFQKLSRVWYQVRAEAYNIYGEGMRALTDSRLEEGVFSIVAQKLGTSESTIKRHYYDYVAILEASEPLVDEEVADLLSQLSPRYLGESEREE